MNGVRRFLGAATGASPPSPDKDSPGPLSTTNTTAPLSFAKNGAQAPNWPPQPSSSPKQPSFSESIQSTAALFLGKKDKSRQATAEEELAVGSPYSATPPLNGLSSHIRSSSREQILRSSPSPSHTPRNGSISGSSSPVLPPTRVITRKSVNKSDLEVKRSSGFANTRDELIFSLLTSDAVVDSRDFTVLTSEEVEDLKKEQQVLNARLVAAKRKLGLETKIRDAAISLSKVNASHRNVSKQTEKQLENANKRVDAAQKDLWSISERANEVHRRLMEHRAGVLSFSVRNMEKKMAPPPTSYDSGYDSNRSTIITSPVSTSTTGTSSGSSKPKFEGAHFFAGHSDAITPKKRLSPEAAAIEIASLETKLKAATESLSAASKQQAELKRELSLARLEKQEVETMRGFDLQAAQETILALEKELPRLEGLDVERQSLLQEKEEWERERSRLEERKSQVEALQARIADLQTRSGEAAGAERLLAEVRGESQRQLEEKKREIEDLRRQWEMEKEEWERERMEWEESREDDMQRLREEMERTRGQDEDVLQHVNQELDDALGALQQMIREHGIVLFSREPSLKGLLEAVSSHLQTVHSKVEGYKNAEADWSINMRKLEDDVRAGLDKRETLARELEEARRERDFAKTEVKNLQEQRSSPIVPVKPILPEVNVSPDAEVNKIVNTLLPIWCILPSPEARAAKFGASSPRTYRTGSPVHSNSAQPSVGSLSELDVRSLKGLYSGTGGAPGSPRTPSSATSATALNTFSIGAFAQRVQALIADDKALIERLIRFAQAHDLLKKNAERAHKLAQDGNAAMETYQKQVRMLEERNQGMGAKMSAMQEEFQLLHETIERLTAEKREIESLAAEQAETCKQLSEANDTLSARTLTLAEEAASAPEKVRKQLEGQISEFKNKLEKAEAEIEEMKTSGQMQRAALFDEMNTMNEENANLRAQLRAVKK
ncbi:hypothetical protein D9756_000267 [Leucocoprinus leucothites]|uniref:Up-regulated during septation protein 1 domain-containing protein n=1 Tax=Leucocoprinus leucothites TaxID=201217 RepID=A0A8H5GEK5_9AGAR|nr:hypothetical protein D9756_000267 [Leucoagaricus leucothites]